MKLTFKVVIGLGILLVAYASCKKSHSSSPQSNIIGKWKNTEVAYDTNNNGIMDPGEIMPVDSLTASTLIVYSSGGTGAITLSGLTLASFDWDIYNTSYLKTILVSGSSGDTTYEHIDTLTSTRMVLRDTSGISAVWNIFVKQ